MTDLLYQTDSYLREFDATVVAVDTEAGRVALESHGILSRRGWAAERPGHADLRWHECIGDAG